MLQGEYTFNTNVKEMMDILAGELNVLLLDEEHWKTFKIGDTFDVLANITFKVSVKEPVDYCCSYF